MAEGETVSQTRSRNLAAIRGKDTAPEMAIRRILHAIEMRFRLHRKDLPGSPDIVHPRHRTVAFVHGCLWQRHEGYRYNTTPKTWQEFWLDKFESNVFRDRRSQTKLELLLGWRVLLCGSANCESLKLSDLGS
jgi:DNA mismatch endonuclease, patch repair protein